MPVRTRWAAVTLVAMLAGPALPGPARACSRVDRIELGQCKPTPTPTPASPRSLERRILAQVNEARAAAGARPVTMNAHAAGIARRHAAAMARSGRLYHNPKVRTASGRRAMGLPRSVGENVGVGPDIETIHAAFMDSRGHRNQILLRSFRTLGVGVAVTEGQVWVTQLFVGPGRSGPPARSSSTSVRRGSRDAPPARPQPLVDRPREASAPTTYAMSAAAPPQAPFPWLATTPSLALGLGLLLRRRRRRRAWTL